MDVTNGAKDSLAATLADGRGAVGVVVGVVGIAVVLVLIGAFWWGMRRRDKESRPPRPDEQPQRPAHRTEIQETDVHGSDHFPEDGRALTPYELSDHGNEAIPPEDDTRRDEPRRD
ncbi:MULTISPECIES: DUF6479 family protein [unclassified Streptomyces]|uniref:DUF6479 family protein n=1 Tax=Streptomyces TaxID=1883 RepID=UPI0001C19DF4|nr:MULTISPECIES: DUF6479 family protein [unclassified Streptomyces]AEN08230.1 conserved hypothetical protein [Streptomyces sp. SirexAA-E]MYR68269.1 hypothetical protein [Streptomyces sp. SID4939]MYS02607.1 hypothetical protein [Streptomyces sp. SID4940]MYT66624.1 hypothetical protein [Streptomyces sp. SID8357]MYT83545.1 hypothetical protein [Streptomyces sp. SID8360]